MKFLNLLNPKKLAERFKRFFYRGGFYANPSSYGKLDDISHNKVYGLSAISSCVTLISGAIADSPIYAVDDKGKTVRSAVVDAINNKINAISGISSFLESVVTQILLQGNSYCWIERSPTGKFLHLWRLPFRSVRPFIIHGQLKYFVQVTDINVFPPALLETIIAYGADANHFVLEEHEICNFKNANFDLVSSPSCLDGAIQSLRISQIQEDYVRNYFQTGAHESVVISRKGNLTDETRAKFENKWRDRYGGVNNTGSVMVLDGETNITKLSGNLRDAQMVEARDFEVTNIARAFRVPSFMINQEAKTTSFGSGISQIYDSFYAFTLNPHINRITDELNRKLMVNDKASIKIGGDPMTRSSTLERYTIYEKAIAMGVLTPQDVKNREGI